MAGPAPIRTFEASPYDYGEVRAIAAGLELAEPVAVTLVRRGHRTVESARRFLAGEESHDPSAFEAMDEVCGRVLSAVRSGRRLTVHGDYDVDGVCATAILVGCLRELGASCDWLIPDRLSEGYGLSPAGVEALARRGTDLAITVDCGIGSAAEARLAREAGIELIVTDHHQPPADLPDCPVLHPALSGYPFEALCGAAVAHKLASALRAGGGRPDPDRDLDLVALATVADLVPLVGENRRLVREGIRAIRTAPRPGLRALMAVARTDPEALDAGALSFRLAPRINAAGRLHRADAGVELLLTEDPERAAAIAAELDRANQERRAIEREVVESAERARAALPQEHAEGAALVLAGEGWHPGVVGIAASRLVDAHWRPVVAISLEAGRGRGSGRSVPGFDLVRALEECGDHLERFGGHPMAAGLELEASRVEAFREAFLASAEEALGRGVPVRTDRVDALVGVGEEGIGHGLAEQLERLGPFGAGNPDPRLLVPSARVTEVRAMGEEGRHARFELCSGTGRAQGVAFGVNGSLSRAGGEPIDLAVGLELDRWNGAVQPRVVLRELYPAAAADRGPDGCGSGDCPADDGRWWERVRAELASAPGRDPADPDHALPAPGAVREGVDRRGGAVVAAVAELISSGGSVLALCADASRRRGLAEAAADPRRFGGGPPAIACARCGEAALDRALGEVRSRVPAGPGLVLADWVALGRRPAAAARFEHVVMVDPPPFAEHEAAAAIARSGPAGAAPFAGGFLHLAWGEPELELAERCLASEWAPPTAIREIWRGLERAGGRVEGAELRSLLEGSGRHPRWAEAAARCLAPLRELGLCDWELDRPAPSLGVVSSEETKLERSRAHRAHLARHQEGLRYLRSRAPRSRARRR